MSAYRSMTLRLRRFSFYVERWNHVVSETRNNSIKKKNNASNKTIGRTIAFPKQVDLQCGPGKAREGLCGVEAVAVPSGL
jgi:hypothetical protein